VITLEENNKYLVIQLNEERERNAQLEKKIARKEDLLNERRDFHSQMCQTLDRTQTELKRCKAEMQEHQSRFSLELQEATREARSLQTELAECQRKNTSLEKELENHILKF
jgi:chromosome segregation ATPase